MKFIVIFNQSQATSFRWSLCLLGSEAMICIVLSCSSSIFIHTWFLADCVATIAYRYILFHLYQQNKGKGKRGSSYRLAIVAKDFLKLTNLLLSIKQNNFSLCRNFGCWGFWQIWSNIPLPFYGPQVLSPASNKAKVLLKYFLRFLIMMIQVSLYLLFFL